MPRYAALLRFAGISHLRSGYFDSSVVIQTKLVLPMLIRARGPYDYPELYVYEYRGLKAGYFSIEEQVSTSNRGCHELVIVSSFLHQNDLSLVGVKKTNMMVTHIEDCFVRRIIHTECFLVGRHNGESFNLPSRITTVRGICRRR